MPTPLYLIPVMPQPEGTSRTLESFISILLLDLLRDDVLARELEIQGILYAYRDISTEYW